MKNNTTKILQRFHMKLFWKLRWYIFSQKIGKALSFLKASIYIFLLFILVWGMNKVIPFTQYMQDPAIATLIGAIVGALVGGIFAYTAAFDVHKSELESMAALKRRDDIYKPLYNETRELKEKINEKQENNLFELLVETNLSKYLKQSEFWVSTTEDVKRFQVPIDLENTMNKLRDLIKAYSTMQAEVAGADKYTEIVRRRLELLKNLQNDDQDEKTKEAIILELIVLKQTLTSFDSYKKFETLHKEINILVEDFLSYLELLIKYINDRYEQRANWY